MLHRHDDIVAPRAKITPAVGNFRRPSVNSMTICEQAQPPDRRGVLLQKCH